jgi:mucin-19
LVLSNSNYAITGVTTALQANISKAPLTVTADSGNMTYGSNPQALSYTYTGLVGNEISAGFTGSLSSSISSSSMVGSVAVTQGSLVVSGNYQISTFNPGLITVLARPITITADANQSKIYGNSEPSYTYAIEAAGANRGLVIGDTFSGALARTAGENVGSYAINQGSLANSNYDISFVSNDFAITARPITITADANQSKIYGNSEPSYTYAIEAAGTNRGLVIGDTFTGALARAAGENVGIYAINQGSLANSNYAINFVSDNLTITARPITITAPVINKVYDGGYTYDFTPGDLLALNSQLVRNDTFNAAKAVFSGNNANVGNDKVILIDPASVVINDGNGGRNYVVSSVNSIGNITPANLFVTAANDAKFSVEADPIGYAGALYRGFVNGETITNLPSDGRTLQITRSNATNNLPGNYALIPSGHGAQGEIVGNYRVSYINGTYTILGPQDVLIRASSTVSYGSTPTYTYTAKYLDSNGQTIAYIGINSTDSNPINLSSVGSSAFTLSDGAGASLTTAFMPLATTESASGNINAGQYNLSSAANPIKTGFVNLAVVGSLVIEPLVITTPNLSANSITKVYDGSSL